MTDEEKWKARILRAETFDYKQRLRAIFPVAIDQLGDEIDRKKFKGDKLLRAVEVIRDSIHGKPAQVLTGPDGGPLVTTFVGILAAVNGSRVEKLAEPVQALTPPPTPIESTQEGESAPPSVQVPPIAQNGSNGHGSHQNGNGSNGHEKL